MRLERAEGHEDRPDAGRHELAELLPAEQGHLPRRRGFRLGRGRSGRRRGQGRRRQDHQDLSHVGRLLARSILRHPDGFAKARRRA
ncbi:MAG: hypothetical protein MZV64_50160 [Ignavibacteriales bacterium]|nr:hypothetical protein [Ignavibacteriales bacterium]